jgi:hypothetical protein
MKTPWRGKDSRWGERFSLNAPVLVSASTSADAEGCMENLSLSGALVKADVEDLGLHALVQVSITMPTRPQRAAMITAYVSRKVAHGVGVEWCEFAPSVIKDLLRTWSTSSPD